MKKQTVFLFFFFVETLSAQAMEETSANSFSEGVGPRRSSRFDDPYRTKANEREVEAVYQLAPEGLLNTDVHEEIDRLIQERVWKNKIGPAFLTMTEKQLEAFIHQVYLEFKRGSIPIDSSQGMPDYGYSFVGLCELHCALFRDIATTRITSGVRPIVGDFGAGHGTNAWKILALGGYVICVEKLRDIALELQKNLSKAGPFMQGMPIKDVCRIIVGDVLNSDNKAYSLSYDITLAANVLHLMAPEKAKAFVKKLFDVSNPGARTYGQVHAPEDSEVAFLLEQKNAGQEFPGYMIVDKGVHADVLPIPGNEKQMDMVNHQFVSIPVSHAPDGFIPQFFYEGSFKNNGQPRKTWIKEREKIEVINTHVALMYFDEDVLRQLYTDAGFVVDDIYYEYAGERVSDTLKPDMTSPGFKLSIIAHKPL